MKDGFYHRVLEASEYGKSECSKIFKFFETLEDDKRINLNETVAIQQCIQTILRSPMNRTPNIILVTCLNGYRHRITREATLPTNSNDWYSFLWRKLIGLLSFNQGGDLFNWSILGDDVDRLTNELKAGFEAELEVNENIRTVNRFSLHKMLSNDEVVKIQSGNKIILEEFAYSLLDKQIPSFDRNDQLFVEIVCVRSTFSVNKFNGDSDVGDIVMLVIFFVVTFFVVTFFRGDFFRYVGDFLYVLNRSPTS